MTLPDWQNPGYSSNSDASLPVRGLFPMNAEQPLKSFLPKCRRSRRGRPPIYPRLPEADLNVLNLNIPALLRCEFPQLPRHGHHSIQPSPTVLSGCSQPGQRNGYFPSVIPLGRQSTRHRQFSWRRRFLVHSPYRSGRLSTLWWDHTHWSQNDVINGAILRAQYICRLCHHKSRS